MQSREEILSALATVDDPELGMSIVELGMIARLEVGADAVDVDIIPTSPACPLGGWIVDSAHRALTQLVGDRVRIQVQLVHHPPWSPERLSTTARRALGW